MKCKADGLRGTLPGRLLVRGICIVGLSEPPGMSGVVGWNVASFSDEPGPLWSNRGIYPHVSVHHMINVM